MPGALPFAARLQKILGELAYRAMPAAPLELMAADRANLRHRVADGYRQANDPEQRDVRKVVADERRFVGVEMSPRENGVESGELVAVGILRHVIDAELHRTEAHALRHTAGDDRHVQPGESQHRDTESVLDLVALELEPAAVDVAEVDAAVSHHSVDVECDELDLAGERGIDHRRTRSQTSMARCTRSSSCS